MNTTPPNITSMIAQQIVELERQKEAVLKTVLQCAGIGADQLDRITLFHAEMAMGASRKTETYYFDAGKETEIKLVSFYYDLQANFGCAIPANYQFKSEVEFEFEVHIKATL